MTLKLDFKSLNPEFTALLRYIFKRQTSAFTIIFGRRGSGKTDLSLSITEILEYYSVMRHYATNIKIYESPFKIESISDLQTLIEWCEEQKGKKLYILDEAGRAFKKRTPMAKINVEIIDKLQILRKYKLSLILVTPREGYLDKVALGSDVLDGVFRKISYNNPKLALYEDQLEGFTLTISNIPGTTIKFDTWDSAPFQLERKILKPIFKDEEKNYLWKYGHGATVKSMGLHPEYFRRINRKYLRESLKRDITLHKT